MNDIIDLHTHTIACGHAYNTLYEMIQAGADAGMKLFGSSDHGPLTPGSCHKFYFTNFKSIPRELFGIHVLMGCEVNILDFEGHVDLDPSLLAKIDYAIASLHISTCAPGTVSQNTDAYIHVMKNPFVQIIGHPDDDRYPVDYDALVAAAKEHRMILEVNNSSFHPLSSRSGAREHYLTMLERCVHYQVPILMGSDAHSTAGAGRHSRAIQLLEEIDFPQELVLNTSVEKLFPYIPVLKTIAGGCMEP
ncbi:MAG: phosphatase [Hungatella sp.]|nr:phosphatase [Hungatella sp.]